MKKLGESSFFYFIPVVHYSKQDAVLLQGGPRDAAVNFGTYRYRSLQWHRGFSATARLSCIGLHQRPFKCCNYTKYADFHGRDAKSVTAENHSI